MQGRLLGRGGRPVDSSCRAEEQPSRAQGPPAAFSLPLPSPPLAVNDLREVRVAGGLEQGAASLRRQEAGPPPLPPLFLSSLHEAAAARTRGKSPRAGDLPRNSIYAVDSRPFPSSADATRSISRPAFIARGRFPPVSSRPLDSPPDSAFLCSGVRHRPLGARPTPFHA
jgi:hypothetical protein